MKVRIMFTQNIYAPAQLTEVHRKRRFLILYYFFLRYAFGLQYVDSEEGPFDVEVLLDALPANESNIEDFKRIIARTKYDKYFASAKIEFPPRLIHEVNSKNEVPLQYLDVILGAMPFRLNNKHKKIPTGKKRRNKGTVAKEELYRYILAKIRNIDPRFNIGNNTGKNGPNSNIWNHQYRHWKFIPKKYNLDLSRAKKK